MVRPPLLLAAAPCAFGLGPLGIRSLVAQPVPAHPAPGAAPIPTGTSLTGTVRDSATGRLLAGAAVLLRDSLDRTLAQGVTDERGHYVLAGAASARRLRVLRIGFRPAELRIGPSEAGPRDVALAPVPLLLAPVRVTASARCPRGTNTPAALGLLEQMRAGLLATVIAGAQQPESLTVLSYEREYAPADDDRGPVGEGALDRIARQSVHVRTSRATAAPFGASRSGAEFVANGFRADSAGQSRYSAPDPETLVDDGFAAGYCFRVVTSDQPNLVGVGFAAPRRRRGRVDVDGVLWADTVARVVRELAFRYVNVGPDVEAFAPGGRLSFREMPTGVAFIDRWVLRIVSLRARPERPVVVEAGGELARAAWPDGRRWRAPLGAWRLQLTDRHGRPAAGAAVRLVGTDYAGTADSAGVVDFTDLLPGPYTASVVDPQLAGRGPEVTQRVVAVRDSTVASRLTVDMAERFGARFPGVSVGATPSGGLVIRIRGGATSLVDGEEPLYVVVVDGVPLPQGAAGASGLESLKPDDVENIEVLNNPADVGRYGVRGATAVIRITTRRGRPR